MGFHEVCRDPMHHFDRELVVEILYNESKKDYMMSGTCRECGTWRIVYFSELRKPEVIYKDFKK